MRQQMVAFENNMKSREDIPIEVSDGESSEFSDDDETRY